MPAAIYTITNPSQVGSYTAATTLGDFGSDPLGIYPVPLEFFSGGWTTTAILCSPRSSSYFHFTGMNNAATVLRSAGFISAHSLATSGSGPWIFWLEVVVQNIAAPSTATVPRYRAVKVGELWIGTAWGGAVTVNAAAAQVSNSNYVWTPSPAGGVGAINAAWCQFDDGVARSMVLRWRLVTGVASLLATDIAGIYGTLNVNTSAAERAIHRCPRCGTVIEPDRLVRDGYTRAFVCSQCYDPAMQRNFRWPFAEADNDG